jgi:hypothetical protein
MAKLSETAFSDELERLKIAESHAKCRYYEAVEKSDLLATKAAADDWSEAGDAIDAHCSEETCPIAVLTEEAATAAGFRPNVSAARARSIGKTPARGRSPTSQG